MKALWLSGALLLGAVQVHANVLLDRFTRADGAITVRAQGDFVDPYFANKALIIGWEAGLDVSQDTQNWLTWLLPRQRRDGGFDRYCADGTAWRACKKADADDSTAATFLHLNALYSQAMLNKKRMATNTAPATTLRTADIASSAQKAQFLLQNLSTPRGTYRAFADKPMEFLMDNTEVYASFVATGQRAQAAQLKQAIEKHFFTDSEWQPANESYAKLEFYPSAIAPTYRWHTGLVAREALDQEFSEWTKKWGAAWLTRAQDEYAWGLIAWGARNAQEQHWIRCWRHQHRAPERNQGWTVLDEMVDRGLAHLGVEPVAQACETVLGKK
jgi:hypothetical protein